MEVRVIRCSSAKPLIDCPFSVKLGPFSPIISRIFRETLESTFSRLSNQVVNIPNELFRYSRSCSAMLGGLS